MDVIEVSDGGTPECGGSLVAGERACRANVERCRRHVMNSDLRSGLYVEAVEQSLEAAAAKVDISEPCGERFGAGKWL